MKSLTIHVFLVMILATPAAAQNDHANAATHYQRAIDVMESLSWDEHNTFWEYYGPTFSPTQELRDALRKAQPALHHFNRGTLQEYSHFNLDVGNGVEIPTSHLMNLRKLAMASRADVSLRLHDGDTSGAANRIAAMNRSMTHFQDDRMLVSSLVGVAISVFTDNLIETGLDHAAFDPSDLLRMLHPLEQFMESSDPFGFVESLAAERDATLMLLNEGTNVDGINARVLTMWSGSDTLDQEQFDTLSNDELSRHVDAYDTTMDDIIDAFTMADRETASAVMAEIQSSFLESEQNLLAPLIVIYAKAMESRNLAESTVQDRITMMRELLDDDVDAVDIANAAVWYLRGVTALDELDDDMLTSLREMDMAWDSEVPESVDTLLRGSGAQVIEHVRTGSNIRRCDFSIARIWYDHPPIPHYVPGMRDLFRLLHADAIRMMQVGEIDAAAERLAICYRVVDHLSGDGQMLSSLLAHTAYEHTHLLVDFATFDNRWNPEHVYALAAAFDRLGRADPFGYGRASSAMRDMASKVHHYYGANRVVDDDDLPVKFEKLQFMTADEALALLQFHDVIEQRRRVHLAEHGEWVPPDTSPEFSINALQDVIALDRLTALCKQSKSISNEMLQEAFDYSEFPPLITFTEIPTRMQQARDALRIGAAMFQHAGDES